MCSRCEEREQETDESAVPGAKVSSRDENQELPPSLLPSPLVHRVYLL